MNFVNTPLSEIQKSLEAKLQIAINLDDNPLRDAGVTPDTGFTLSGNYPTAHEALHELLESKDLNWYISGGVLQITTSDVAKATTVVRVYPVSDLCLTTDGEGNYSYDFDSLIELITATVSPSSWDQNGGAARSPRIWKPGRSRCRKRAKFTSKSPTCSRRLREARHLQHLDAGFRSATAEADEDRSAGENPDSLPWQITSPTTTGSLFDVSGTAAPSAANRLANAAGLSLSAPLASPSNS